jgi:hypothetical protein
MEGRNNKEGLGRTINIPIRIRKLAPVVMKLHSRTLEKRLRIVIQDNCEEEQSAFRPLTLTQSHTFATRMATNKLLRRGRDIHTAFLDLKAAFDTAPRKTPVKRTKKTAAHLLHC